MSKHIKAFVKDEILPDEKLAVYVEGWSDKFSGNAVLFVTNKRVLVLRKTMFGVRVESLNLDQISEVSKKKGILKASINIKGVGASIEIDNIPKDFLQTLSHKLEQLRECKEADVGYFSHSDLVEKSSNGTKWGLWLLVAGFIIFSISNVMDGDRSSKLSKQVKQTTKPSFIEIPINVNSACDGAKGGKGKMRQSDHDVNEYLCYGELIDLGGINNTEVNATSATGVIGITSFSLEVNNLDGKAKNYIVGKSSFTPEDIMSLYIEMLHKNVFDLGYEKKDLAGWTKTLSTHIYERKKGDKTKAFIKYKKYEFETYNIMAYIKSTTTSQGGWRSRIGLGVTSKDNPYILKNYNAMIGERLISSGAKYVNAESSAESKPDIVVAIAKGEPKITYDAVKWLKAEGYANKKCTDAFYAKYNDSVSVSCVNSNGNGMGFNLFGDGRVKARLFIRSQLKDEYFIENWK